MRMELYAPDGGPPLVFDHDQRLTIPRIEGLSEAGIVPVTQGAPGQYGETALDVTVGVRTLALTIAYRATDHDDAWAMRRRLVRAFATPPATRARPPAPALFRCHPPGLPPVELPVYPRNSPQIDPKGPLGFYADVELVAPQPFWREAAERFHGLTAGGGFSFPTSFPRAFPSYNAEVVIDHPGNVPVGLRLRLYGAATTPRLRQLTAGEVLEITGAVAAGTYVEIETGFGRKRAELVDEAGTRLNIMGRVSRARGDFFRLIPGANTLRYEADSNQSGRGMFWWSPEYSGL